VNLTTIETIDDLKYYLAVALKLEHATIPPYLTALYSIVPGSNREAANIIRLVAVEEMLHMTLVANLMNAIGATPDPTGDDFVPEYPAYLPDGERDFQVNISALSRETIDNFLQIERPAPPPTEQQRRACCGRQRPPAALLKVSRDAPHLEFYSIGEFYAEIGRGFEKLHGVYGPELFRGNRSRQVTPDYYYSGGGALFAIDGIESVRKAWQLIAEQGEGYGGTIYDHEGELAHYYRFQQLKLGRYYQKGDQPDHPTGATFDLDFNRVYKIRSNARLEHYPQRSELYAAAVDFANTYKGFLGLIAQAYSGQPRKLRDAVAWMFAIKDKALTLIRNPIPGTSGVNAAPIFALPKRGQTGSSPAQRG
jgi:hypothetical protein